MERNIQKNGLINLLVLLVAAGAGFAVSRYAHLLSGQIAGVFIALGALAAVVSWFQMRLEDQERLEKLEWDELSKSAERARLFETAQADTFPARRSREQFERFFVPGFTVALLLLEGAGAWFFWQWLGKTEAAPIRQSLVALALLGMLALILFLMGKYSAGIARLEQQRLLRPAASHLLLGAYLLAAVMGGIVADEMGYPHIDAYLARALSVLLAVLAVENLLALLLEIYRPRVKGKAERVLYESRLVGLLSQPEGLFTTAAHALDYQFGFKVSETWFYRFLERAFVWLLLAQLGLLLLSTCFVFIQPGEQGLLERFGKPVTSRALLGPGPHLKFPWPIDQVYRYTNEAVQSFVIGYAHDDHEGHEEDADHAGESKGGETVLWTVSHTKEEFRLLVASREQTNAVSAAPANETVKKAPPVNLLAASIKVQYQIQNLSAWAYQHNHPEELLEKIGTREVVRYLVSVDYNEVVSSGRFQAAEDLRQRIQAAADDLKLGVKILVVGFADCHPPVQVARSYEEVVGARQKREANLLAARAHQIRTNTLASAAALQRKRAAESASLRDVVTARARAAAFTNQIAAFQAAPSVFSTRAYLQALIRGGAGARKYVLASTNTQDVYTLNLEDKLRADLLDTPMPISKSK